jgi:L-lactate dehydrogenase complex protein LldF
VRITTERFHEQARAALADPELRAALDRAADGFVRRRSDAMAALPTLEALRSQAAAVKAHVLDHLDHYLERFAEALEAVGGHVHFAADAAEARQLVLDLARRYDVSTVVKAKSMISEEIGLNQALADAGVRAVEGDLGEFILQLAGDVPSHLIGPAIHWTRPRVARLFAEHLGSDPEADAQALTEVARTALREVFLSADMGVSGVNFAVAESGSLVLVENEGNIRITTGAPRVHVALMGLEKVLPRLADVPTFLALLARSATGQAASAYVSLLTGPRRPGEVDGPEHLHVVVVDAGRSAVLADPALRDALRCIRCGACLNHCPVYQRVGGHAYGWVYGGPIGAILDPGLLGLPRTRELPQASSLCGACSEVCPVKIPIDDLLVEHRRRAVERGLTGRGERWAMGAFAFLGERPGAWAAAANTARAATRLRRDGDWLTGALAGRLPGLGAWLRERDFPAPAARSFRQRWRDGLRHEPSARRDAVGFAGTGGAGIDGYGTGGAGSGGAGIGGAGTGGDTDGEGQA